MAEARDSKLELLEAEEEVVSLEQQLDDLDALLSVIDEEIGVSRTHMVTLESIAADSIPEHYPLASFTELPSMTNYEVALESVLSAIGTGIKKAFQALIAFFKKVIKAILRLFGFGKERVTKVLERAERSWKMDREVSKVVKAAGAEVREEVERRAKKAQQEVLTRLFEQVSELGADVLNDGKLRKDMLKWNGQFLKQIKFTQERLDVLQSVVKDIKRLPAKATKAGESLDLNQLDFKSRLDYVIAKDADLAGETFHGRVQAFQDAVNGASEKRFKGLDAALLQRWWERKAYENLDFLDDSKTWAQSMTRIEEALDKLEKEEFEVQDQELAKLIRQAFTSIRLSISSLALYSQCVQTTLGSSLRSVEVLVGFAEAGIKESVEVLIQKGAEEIREKIRKIVSKFRNKQ